MDYRPYYTLIIRRDGVWEPQFGDYDHMVVAKECRDSYSDIARGNRKIIRTARDQASINAAIAKQNF